jgi:hypothetical protein
MENKHRHGAIYALEIWCDKCNTSHRFTVEEIIKFALNGEKKFCDVLGEELFRCASAIALAMGFGEVLPKNPDNYIVKPYNNKDLNDFLTNTNT